MAVKENLDHAHENRNRSRENYWPLAALVIVSLLGACALAIPGNSSPDAWMHYFMGLFLCLFASFKLVDPRAFADGFEMYDLLARRVRGYGFIYPYIELFLGLAYLAFVAQVLVYLLTILVLGFGALGVISALRRGLDIDCPCMGSVLDVPLSTVTLAENISMVVMAAIMWLMLS